MRPSDQAWLRGDYGFLKVSCSFLWSYSEKWRHVVTLRAQLTWQLMIAVSFFKNSNLNKGIKPASLGREYRKHRNLSLVSSLMLSQFWPVCILFCISLKVTLTELRLIGLPSDVERCILVFLRITAKKSAPLCILHWLLWKISSKMCFFPPHKRRLRSFNIEFSHIFPTLRCTVGASTLHSEILHLEETDVQSHTAQIHLQAVAIPPFLPARVPPM